MLLIDAFLSILNNMTLPKHVCIQYGVVPIAVAASLEREKGDNTEGPELCGQLPRNFMYLIFLFINLIHVTEALRFICRS